MLIDDHSVVVAAVSRDAWLCAYVRYAPDDRLDASRTERRDVAATKSIDRFEAQLDALDEENYELTLFVSGASDLSARAIANAGRLCDVHLHGRCHLSVVDVHEDPAAVLTSRLLATPTLVRNVPLPVRRVVGDLSDTDKVLRVLDLPFARPSSIDQG